MYCVFVLFGLVLVYCHAGMMNAVIHTDELVKDVILYKKIVCPVILLFAKCLRRGAYLANFETLNEAMLMKYELQKMKTGVHYYVGGRNINRYKTGGDWRWIKKDGEMVKMKYFAFDNGEPNGTLKAAQDCMFFYASRGYRFHAVSCAIGGLLGGYICEK